MPEITRLEMLTIRYLSLMAEKLALATSGPIERLEADVIGKCCDRVEHIAQYAIDNPADNSFRLHGLIDDIQFLKSVFARHSKALASGLPRAVPTLGDLEKLLAECVAECVAEKIEH